MQKKKPKTKKKITKKTTTKKVVISKKVKSPSSVSVPSKKDVISNEELDVLLEACDGDKDLALFASAYFKNSLNSSKAYKLLHPDCSDASCRVLGSRMLAKLTKVNMRLYMEFSNLGTETYMKKIASGLEAKRVEIVNVRVKHVKGKDSKIIYDKIETDDHSIQIAYLDKLGKILGIEGKDNPSVAVQINNLLSDKKDTYGI